MGDSRMSSSSSFLAGVDADPGRTWLSQVPVVGLAGLASPVCQMPKVVPDDVCIPHRPLVLYSHIGAAGAPVGVLEGCRKGTQPPLLRSKSHGTLWAGSAGLFEFRMPRSTALFGMRSRSIPVKVPLRSRSSPIWLVKLPAGAPLPANMLEKVTRSFGLM